MTYLINTATENVIGNIDAAAGRIEKKIAFSELVELKNNMELNARHRHNQMKKSPPKVVYWWGVGEGWLILVWLRHSF